VQANHPAIAPSAAAPSIAGTTACEQGETFCHQGQRNGYDRLATVPAQLLGHGKPGNLGDPPQAGRQGDKGHRMGGEDSPTWNIG
jgi:hypothetical protein